MVPADVFSDASSGGVESVILLAADDEFFNTAIRDAVGSSVDESNMLTVDGGRENLKSITESLKNIICGGLDLKNVFHKIFRYYFLFLSVYRDSFDTRNSK